MSLTELLVPTFTQFLRGLSSWLDKAAGHRQAIDAEPDALLSERLAEDMYPLAAQIRFACFQALEPVCRLRGEPLPDALLAVRQEGWNANAQPGTWSDAKARIDDALATLDSLPPNALDQGGTLSIALELPNGAVFDMTGEQYARDWALPQFYFHVVAAYAILRNHGVELGKADYVSYMLAYLRSGTMPQR
ncbi:DUF1993 family protein [Burkholderia ubonensis]|uniref:DUF1993 domain-containing protein n=1 Tax=Burkholderia ubonensis TaxID=101571 RepID=A0ABD4E9G3_9BURK|nr:DUF1993 domain-containing protein [Burkholderia ubonensis]KVN92159.1 hypothetical protein WJ68_34340 [Burkholderia ubonensis]KVZ69428.1 hypothetical protein WL19_19720 [Burkholderia ubonensis]KVZ85664.1 hypothetical protein WL24_10310 [Burkholderia ubonensis]